MTVDSVSGNNNTALYTGIGTVAGAGAGVATGYLTKPFLKNGVVTDEFVKKVNDAVKNTLTPDQKILAENIDEAGKNLLKAISNAKSIEERKKLMLDNAFNELDDLDIDIIKQGQNGTSEVLKGAGIKETYAEKLSKAKDLPEMKEIYKRCLEDEWKGKTLEQVKEHIKSESAETAREITQGLFNEYWNTDKKVFENCENDAVGKAIKGVAKRIQGKYAAIYGSIGAAALGIGTYLCCRGKQPKTQAQTTNNKVQS